MRNKIILLLLSVLGVSAGKAQERVRQTVLMYGVPTTSFSVKGKVADKRGRPIKGIVVSVNDRQLQGATDENGIFEISFRIPGRIAEHTAALLFEDVDGPQNGGRFAAKQVETTFREGEQHSTWTRTMQAEDMVVVLDREKEVK